MNLFLSKFYRVFIEQIVSCLMTVCRMIRMWSWPDLRSDIVSFGKYERARNAAVRISDLWPHIYVQDHPGTKQELCQ